MGLAVRGVERRAVCSDHRQTEHGHAWHRRSFRLFWTWKVRRGQPGRPAVSKEIRQLIRKMSRENPLWGVPRIHGELLKLGIDIGETSVGKYLVRPGKPPSQTGEPSSRIT
jgi:putative transposase